MAPRSTLDRGQQVTHGIKQLSEQPAEGLGAGTVSANNGNEVHE
jgi:hypothetical protein